MDAVTMTCDICGEPIVGGGYFLPRGPGGVFATNCCGRPGCLEVWMISLDVDNDGKQEGV